MSNYPMFLKIFLPVILWAKFSTLSFDLLSFKAFFTKWKKAEDFFHFLFARVASYSGFFFFIRCVYKFINIWWGQLPVLQKYLFCLSDKGYRKFEIKYIFDSRCPMALFIFHYYVGIDMFNFMTSRLLY